VNHSKTTALSDDGVGVVGKDERVGVRCGVFQRHRKCLGDLAWMVAFECRLWRMSMHVLF
jgi:hypothetical protein